MIMKKICLFLLLAIGFLSCEVSEKASTANHAFLYNRNVGRLHPQFNIYHVSETQSKLDFLLDASELLYMKRGMDSTSRSQISISIVLHAGYESTEILDSASIHLSDVSDGKNDKYIHGEIKFKATYPNTYYLQVNVVDQNRKANVRTTLFVNKSNHSNAQNFLVLSDEGREYFGSAIGAKDKVQILSNDNRTTGYFVKYYNWKFHLPAPPFSLTYQAPAFNHRPDSLYRIPVPGGEGVGFPKEGLYLLQPDTSKPEGLTLMRFYDGFPEVTHADLLVNALRFITNKEEFNKMHSSADKKAAVDKFWLDLAGNEDRAKELISKYYNRVEEANRYFTSYTEGWRTDRGMVYLIFGPAPTVYKNASTETWVYNERSGAKSFSFIFVHANNRFTDNDYQLKRDASLKIPWYKAVEAWRQGRMYAE
jgi:GWxTD domain-containing protein